MDTTEYNEYQKNSPEYQEAKTKVKNIRKFHKKFASYAAISLFLLAINLYSSPGYIWAFWPILGMGLGLALSYIKNVGVPFSEKYGADWEERKLKEELTKMELDSGKSEFKFRSKRQEDIEFDLDAEIELEEKFSNLKKNFKDGFS